MLHRKTKIVEPEVQWALSRRIVTHWCWFALAVVGVNVVLNCITALGNQTLLESATDAFIGQVPMLGTLAVLLPIFVLDTLRLSNRFAGPMYRLRRSLEQLAAGENVPPISYRRGDFWTPSAESFNRLRHRLASLQLVVDQLNRKTAEQEAEEDDLQIDHLEMDDELVSQRV